MKGLLIAYWFPAKNSIASFRPYSFAKYFNLNGVELDVICPEWIGTLNLEKKFKIFNTHKIEDNIRYGYYKSKLQSYFIKEILYKIFRYNHFRDLKKGAFYQNGIKTIDNIDLSQYKFVITTFGPLDSIYLGKYIKELNENIKWFIDYRDYFSLLDYANYGIFKIIFKLFEKSITKRADYFITVSEKLFEKQKKFLKKDGFVCYNGYDEFEIKEDDVFLKNKINSISLPIISHTGSLYNGERNLDPIFNFFRLNKLDLKYSLCFAILNDDDEIYLNKLNSIYKLENVKIYRNLTFNQSLLLQKNSCFLLLLTSIDKKGNGYLTGKLYEYIYSNKPIIYSGITDNYELYSFIKKYNLGDHYELFNFNSENYYIQSKETKMFKRENQAKQLMNYIISKIKE